MGDESISSIEKNISEKYGRISDAIEEQTRLLRQVVDLLTRQQEQQEQEQQQQQEQEQQQEQSHPLHHSPRERPEHSGTVEDNDHGGSLQNTTTRATAQKQARMKNNNNNIIGCRKCQRQQITMLK